MVCPEPQEEIFKSQQIPVQRNRIGWEQRKQFILGLTGGGGGGVKYGTNGLDWAHCPPIPEPDQDSGSDQD
ncbi:hypothetical protein CgunFtcFv8_002764 [Champsocephalus gunnari]|uniref:Uncharacterized protein n=1 Tax=Champsocephalus gunnari TaxID=52237 RepID=A0AAN8DBW3_CHAGU|nr:hypothetical protein CgunFtcFv8_002764 [Champsocephalus gunnari]